MSLNFEQLEEKVEELISYRERDHPGKFERIALWGGFAAAGIGVSAASLIGGTAGVWIAAISLAIELVSFTIAIVLTAIREWRSLRRTRRSIAEEMDRDFDAHRECVRWLQQFPSEDIQRHLRYVQIRKESVSTRLGLVTGGVERLGILPVLIALYVQFKDWELGDWSALSEVNFLGGLLLFSLALVYAGSWWIVGLRHRLSTYEDLLVDAQQLDPQTGRVATQVAN